jgi:sugar lactone lactonase YvrE
MTLASWFSSLQHSRRRRTRAGARRSRSHASRRSATFEALEDRSLLSSVGFSTASETVNASAGTFSIPVTLSGTRTQTVSTFASGFDFPLGLAFDSAGNLYVSNQDNGTVNKVTPAGTVSTFATGFVASDGLAFDASGNLFVANFDTNTVSKVTPAGAVSTFATGFDDPSSLAFDASGNLFVANVGNDTVSEVTPAGTVSTFATGFDVPAGLAFDASGNLFVSNGGNTTVREKTVSEVTPAGVVSTFATGLIQPAGLAFDAAGNLYVANATVDAVSEVTPAGTVSTFATGFDEPEGLAFGASNLYVANGGPALDPGTTVSEVSETVTVPFTLGGTAVAGTAFSGIAAGPLTFGIGQTTQDITGTLLSDPGPSQTLTLTLGTPTGGGVGSPSVTTLTITEPAAVQFSTGSETVDESAGTFSIPVTLAGSTAVPITVPFTLGGTAVAGTAFSGVTASPLTFAVGQTTQDITGKLLSDPGPNQTLTLTLGTPTGSAALVSPSVNTLTITEPAAVGTTTGTGTSTTTSSVPPVFIGEQRVFSKKGRHKKLVGFEFLFNGALNPGVAQSTGDYHVTQRHGRKINVLPVTSALDGPGNSSVTITLGGFKTGKPAQVTITGLVGANGAAIPQITSGL